MKPDVAMIAFARSHALLDETQGEWEPLTGGVSSDIWHLRSSTGECCIKRALAQLKVAVNWEVPTDRNAFEWRYMQVAEAVAPGSVPRPLAHDPDRGLFAMAWLAPDRHPLWKSELMLGHVDPDFARAVGDLLGRIHEATADDADIAAQFATDDNFRSIRLDPYLRETAARHPDLSSYLIELADRTAATRHVLVHGDVSPKNILIGPDGPVLLDAECAWFGDPAFDLAFCLNHLVIKARVVETAREPLLESFDALADGYFRHVSWEGRQALEARAAQLLPALALARVDGKSPVEYLDEAAQGALRTAARDALKAAPTSLADARRCLS
jgi:aminoglycoside phosphotransferase (APT) family kinase protein